MRAWTAAEDAGKCEADAAGIEHIGEDAPGGDTADGTIFRGEQNGRGRKMPRNVVVAFVLGIAGARAGDVRWDGHFARESHSAAC